MIQVVFLCFGGAAWILLFTGWWIIPPVNALVIGAGLGCLWFFQHQFHYKWKPVTCAGTLVFINLACAAWFHQFWEKHHYPVASLYVAQFVSIITGMVFLCIFFAYVRAPFSKQEFRPSRKDRTYTFDQFFMKKQKNKQVTDNVSIVLGESVKKDFLREK